MFVLVVSMLIQLNKLLQCDQYKQNSNKDSFCKPSHQVRCSKILLTMEVFVIFSKALSKIKFFIQVMVFY